HRAGEEGRRGVNLSGSLAEPLLLIHRLVRHLDQLVDRVVLVGNRLGDPDTERQSIRTPPRLIAIVQVLPQPREGRLDPFVGLRQQDAKLIAPGSASDVRFSKRRRQDLTKLHQRLVAYRMAKRVVDPLEAIEVDQHEVHRPSLPPSDFAEVRPHGHNSHQGVTHSTWPNLDRSRRYYV